MRRRIVGDGIWSLGRTGWCDTQLCAITCIRPLASTRKKHLEPNYKVLLIFIPQLCMLKSRVLMSKSLLYVHSASRAHKIYYSLLRLSRNGAYSLRRIRPRLRKRFIPGQDAYFNICWSHYSSLQIFVSFRTVAI
jgi:hypothetical protein